MCISCVWFCEYVCMCIRMQVWMHVCVYLSVIYNNNVWRQPHFSWLYNVVMQDKGVEQEDKFWLANLRLAHQCKFYRENNNSQKPYMYNSINVIKKMYLTLSLSSWTWWERWFNSAVTSSLSLAWNCCSHNCSVSMTLCYIDILYILCITHNTCRVQNTKQ